MSSSQSLISSVGDTHNAIHPKKPTENRGEWQENRAWRKETKKKNLWKLHFTFRSKGLRLVGGRQPDWNRKKTTNKSPNKAKWNRASLGSNNAKKNSD